jgi:hypothetical protein
MSDVPLPEPVQRLMRFAGKKRNEVSNPCLTAREAIVVADHIAHAAAVSADLAAENARLREVLQTLCIAADNMREASNWLPVVFGECDPPTDVYVPTKDEAIERYSDAFKSLERATYYARKSIRPHGSQP